MFSINPSSKSCVEMEESISSKLTSSGSFSMAVFRARKPKKGRPDDEELVLETSLDVTEVKKSMFWNHEDVADVVRVARAAKRSADAVWRQLYEEENWRG